MHHQVRIAQLSPALDAPGGVLLLDAQFRKCAFFVDPCQMTTSARRYPHAIYSTEH